MANVITKTPTPEPPESPPIDVSVAASAIESDGLTRYFGKNRVVDRLDLKVPAGRVTALLGLNGAGKTTTIRMMMGLLAPTRGSCRTLDTDAQGLGPEQLSRIGYLVEGHYLPSWMTVRQLAKFCRAHQSRWNQHRFDAIVEHFAVSTKQKCGRISRGQRAGVALASVLAADVELLILDDPALGLDPVSRRALNETLVDFAGHDSGRQRTVLLSTHLLDDVERIADDVAVMIGGRLLVHTTLTNFQNRVTRYAVSKFDNTVIDLPTGVGGIVERRRMGDDLVLTIADAAGDAETLLESHFRGTVESLPTTLSDRVIAYLSRERQSEFRSPIDHSHGE